MLLIYSLRKTFTQWVAVLLLYSCIAAASTIILDWVNRWPRRRCLIRTITSITDSNADNLHKTIVQKEWWVALLRVGGSLMILFIKMYQCYIFRTYSLSLSRCFVCLHWYDGLCYPLQGLDGLSARYVQKWARRRGWNVPQRLMILSRLFHQNDVDDSIGFFGVGRILTSHPYPMYHVRYISLELCVCIL